MEILRNAVRDAVQPGDRVLDLGCGVGVLGLFALEAGAGHVTFVDETAIIEIARESMARAGFAERCSFVEGSSYDISLPERVDIILSDHLGFFGIDYDDIVAAVYVGGEGGFVFASYEGGYLGGDASYY